MILQKVGIIFFLTKMDFWFIDQLTAKRIYSKVINSVLDGSEVDLDCLFEKRKNVVSLPIIMASNSLPKY